MNFEDQAFKVTAPQTDRQTNTT